MDKNSLNRTLVIYNLLNLILLGVLISLKLHFALLMLIMVGSTGLIIYLTHRIIRQQYRMIMEIADKVSSGDHSQRIPTLNIDEFNSLGLSINQMLGKLDNTIGHLAVHREELRLIVSTIEDALWSQNLEGKIEWANDAFRNLFSGFNMAQSQYAWEVIRDPQLTKLIKDYAHASPSRMTELQIDNHYYLLSGSLNEKAGRLVFILQNIDGIRQAEQMKKDFIVNLAHELRTPLTAIKGFSEAMQETAVPENVRYLKIIQNHTQRLIRLIQDLQNLIRLEHSSSIDAQLLNLSTFFENIGMIVQPLLEDKGLQLRLEIDPHLTHFSADPFKFEQIFINLVENSLRYTDSGEITIRTIASPNTLTIEVCDQGSGISAEHLPRIFERFYVADPSRNRSNGGTGLGLAIVKHIVLLHSGSIEVSSELGKGTCFHMQFPCPIKQNHREN